MASSTALATSPNRRRFLQSAAAATAGLTIGFHWAGSSRAATAANDVLAPNAFVRLAPDNTVTVIIKHVEMGQGTYTGLATIVAEELDADWSQVRAESAPADATLYNNLLFGQVQGTGGSTAVANSWDQLRHAGATARAMLVAAAAADWNVPVSEITVERGVLKHAVSGKSANFGALAGKAAAQRVPASVTVKDPKDFRLIGQYVPRLDTPAKTDGTARFALDINFPEMVTTVIERPPLFGATVRSVEVAAAKAIPGVIEVVQVPAGVAVVGKSFWAAKQGRDALKIEWDSSAAEKRSTPELMSAYEELAKTSGVTARKDGDADRALGVAARRVKASFKFPYLAHAPMEPLTCVVRLTGKACEIWAGDQFQTVDQMNAAKAAGLSAEQVTIQTLYAGGSFGRRANAASDYIVEAVSVAKALGANGKPVKLVWTREDDIRGGRYRPMYFHTIEAGLDAEDNLVAWQHRIVGQSILDGTPLAAGMVKKGVDETSVEGASTLPYAIPNLAVELHTTKVGVPVLWWRSVGSTHTAYATEVFLDEVAHAAGKDPVAFRQALLRDAPRHLGALNLAAEKAGWGRPLPAGKGRGVAVHKSFGTYVAQVAEVSVATDGKIKVDRVVCAVDCGVAVNPDVIKAQMEGGIGFGLGAVLYGAITLKAGKVEQSNFHDYQVLRIEDMPKVEVYILPSTESPTGVGEPGVPPIGPALSNAVFAATGKRIRTLPFAVGTDT